MTAQSQKSVNEFVDHLFRHYSGQMVSVLVRIFGLEKLDIIEDAIQDALIAALKNWAYQEIPANPQAWLIQAAKNKILDNLRRNKKLESHDDISETAEITANSQLNSPDNEIYFANEIEEDLLRMMFACCHPKISQDSQVALILKTVSGFSVPEIARAFLSGDEAIAKQLTRAKQTFRQHRIQLEMPAPRSIKSRLDTVLSVFYLIFNEGYSAFAGEDLICTDLCFEAIRLCQLLANHSVTNSPKTHALLALFLFQGARLSARCDWSGELLILSEQNRALWNKKMIASGLKHFRLSANGAEISNYHLEAEIASCYVINQDYESIDWNRVLHCYNLLSKQNSSPVVSINRIIALAKIKGAQAGLSELLKYKETHKLQDYPPFYATLGEFQIETGKIEDAINSYETALNITQNETIKRFLQKKIDKAVLGKI